MARPRVPRGWRKVYHARGVVAPYVGPQLACPQCYAQRCRRAEAIGIDDPK